MTIDINILLQVLIANNQDELIAIAIKHQLSPTSVEIPDTILVNIHRNRLPDNQVWLSGSDSNSYGVVRVPVIEYNHFKKDKPFKVLQPDGSTDWFENNCYKSESVYGLKPVEQ